MEELDVVGFGVEREGASGVGRVEVGVEDGLAGCVGGDLLELLLGLGVEVEDLSVSVVEWSDVEFELLLLLILTMLALRVHSIISWRQKFINSSYQNKTL